MSIGNQISAIRNEQQLTQEQFGELFHVTRQTVSNWENEKSYPDLQTLIKISDMFEISLDTLMKGDKTMVKKFDKELLQNKLIKNILKISSIIIAILVIAYGIYTAIWYNNKKICEEKFQTSLIETGFKFDDNLGHYILESNEAIYYTPNQKMPKYSFHFYNQSISSEIPNEDVFIKIIGDNKIYLNLSNNYTLDSDGNLIDGELSKRDKITYDELKDKIALMSKKSFELYEEIYGQYE